jgi:hypothetical protein
MANPAGQIAGIISTVGPELEFNMPWHDSLMPIGADYHAVERAVHTAAGAGCDTIWVVLDRAAQPIIKKKVGQWVYDPTSVWNEYTPFMSKLQIPIYYICVQPRDLNRRDSQGWGALYTSKVVHYISSKMSMWCAPKRYLFISPYGVSDEETITKTRALLNSKKDIAYMYNGKSFLDDVHLPFTFGWDQYKVLQQHALTTFRGKEDRLKKISEVFAPLKLENMEQVQLSSHTDISNWAGYKSLLAGEEIKRPKYLVSHKWRGLRDV